MTIDLHTRIEVLSILSGCMHRSFALMHCPDTSSTRWPGLLFDRRLFADAVDSWAT